MRAYSTEFWGDVLAACDAGGKTRPVALRFGVSESWGRRIKQERRELGKTVPLLTRRRPPQWGAEADRIRAAISQTPDLTPDELKAHLGTSLGRSALCRLLQALRLTLKKVLSGSEQQRPDVAERRGSCGRLASIRRGSCSSTKRG